MLEDVIRHASTLGNTFGLIKRPMDTEVDAALAVFLLGLRQRFEATREKRAHVPIVVFRYAVELVGDEGEGDVVRAIESSQDLEERSAEAGMSGRVGREGWCEIGAV